MMRRVTKSIICVAIALLLTLGVVLLCCCGNDGYAVMNIKTQAEVEFILDDRQRVVCATPLNDDAEIALYNESFVGLTLKEAIELLLALSPDVCYDDSSSIELTVSGEQAEKLYEEAKKIAEKYLSDNADISFQGVISVDDIKQLLIGMDKTADLAEMHALKDQELIEYLINERKRLGQLCSQPLKDLYLCARNYTLQIKEKQIILDIITALDEDARELRDDYTYTGVLASYTETLSSYKNAVDDVITTMSDTFFATQCEYGRLFESAIQAKSDMYHLIRQNATPAEIDNARVLYESAVEALEIYTVGEFEKTGGINSLLKIADNIGGRLKMLESAFDQDLQDEIADKQVGTDNQIERSRENFINDFKRDYSQIIEQSKQAIADAKLTLFSTQESE